MDLHQSNQVFVFYLKGEPHPFKSTNNQQNSGELVSNSTSDAIQEKLWTIRNPAPEKSGSICRCSKSRCLRLKCSCFVDGRVCGPKCECIDCLNSVSNQALREAAKNLNKKIFNNAFRKSQVLEVNGQRVLDLGCRCKHSGCRNNYCQCVRNGAVCSDLCTCRMCDHVKVKVEPKIANDLRQKNKRKRLRLVINTSEGDQKQKNSSDDILLLEKI